MIKKACNILSTVLFLVLAVIAALLLVPNLFGMKAMAVLSGSMAPKIPVGSIVYVKEAAPDEIREEDVITYAMGSTMVTHRVKEIKETEEQWITKGDANESVDGSPVSYEQLVGKMKFFVPLLGYISIYIKTPLGIAAGCGVLIIMILLTYLPEILKKEEQKENKNDLFLGRHK